MEKIFQCISNIYKCITSRVPLEILHFVICFCVALFSWEFAVGLAVGRESMNLDSVYKVRNSLWGLILDSLGIAAAVTIKLIF